MFEQIPVAVNHSLYEDFERFMNLVENFGQFSTSVAVEADLQKCFTPLDRVEPPTVNGRLDFDLEVPSDSIITLRRARQEFIEQLR